ncbi:anthrone oxygenase family protein [Streptomyces sp. NPDC002734]|uniref:anthrone oxygenase family protein n=1 Tax=Streptomyces sp. NPDC002734 TaxID=3154426 RepID=UPI003319DD3C
MKTLQQTTLILATLATGLMAGLFAAFAYSVMPGLARSSDRTFVEAMQNINKAILNPVFMFPFMAAIPLLGLAVVLAWRGHGRAALPWLIAALVLYLLAFVVTSGLNVPLNDQLAKAGNPDRMKDPAAVRENFESTWVAWNIVRALLHTAAFGCLLWALILFGAHMTQESAATASPTRRPLTAEYPDSSMHFGPARDTGSHMTQPGPVPQEPQARRTKGPRW